MLADPISPIAPARVRVLLLPAGRIKRSRFSAFVKRLQSESAIRLGDVTPDARPDRTMFSPLAFPGGMVLYDMSTSIPAAPYLELSPVELFREPLLVVGVADGLEYPSLSHSDMPNGTTEKHQLSDLEKQLESALPYIQDEFPSALVHSLVVFDCSTTEPPPWLPKETFIVPPEAQLRPTTLKTIVCDITSVFLAEMTGLAKSIEGLSALTFPSGQKDEPQVAPRPGLLSRRSSQIAASSSSRPESPLSRLQSAAANRLSMPIGLDRSSPLSRPGSTQLSPAEGASSPPTPNLEQITGSDPTTKPNLLSRSSGLTRTMSTHSARTSPVSTTGFGSSNVNHRERELHKLRIRLVHGCMFLMTGLWTEALPHFSEVTAQAEAMKESVCYIKGLELMMCALILLSKAKTSIEIPSIALWGPEKSVSSKAFRSSSITSITQLTTPATPGGSNYRERLGEALPLMADTIFTRFRRQADEGTLTFPQPAKSELIVRLVYLLHILHEFGGLTDDVVAILTGSNMRRQSVGQSQRKNSRSHRNELGQLLFAAYPSINEIDLLPSTVTADILAKICRGCKFLGLTRKHLLVQEELIKMITISLQQARKAGAADVGLHPAAGFAASSETNLGNLEVRASLAGSENESNELLRGFLDSFVEDLGLPVLPKPGERKSADDVPTYVKDSLQDFTTDQMIEVFEAKTTLHGECIGAVDIQVACFSSCMKLSEALNDYRGYLHFACYQLRNAVDYAHRLKSTVPQVVLHEAAQHSIYHGIQRTVASAQQHLDSSIWADYWDCFLIRDVSVVMPDGSQDVEEVRLTKAQSTDATRGSQQGVFIHNPFNAVAKSNSKTMAIVSGESYEFSVLVQNPFAFPTEIESIQLVSNGVSIESLYHPVELPGASLHQLTIRASAHGLGAARIVGCLVKMKACQEKFFPIFPDEGPRWGDPKFKTPKPDAHKDSKLPKTMSLPLDVIPPQPALDMKWVSEPQDALVLLENERATVSVDLHNVSSDADVAFIHPEIKSIHSNHETSDSRTLSRAEMHEIEWQTKNRPSARLLHHDTSQTWIPLTIGPQNTERLSFEIIGKPNLTGLEIVIHYRRSVDDTESTPDKTFARKVARSLRVAIIPALQMKLVGVIPYPDSAPDQTARLTKDSSSQCLLRLEFQNRWTSPLVVRMSARSTLEAAMSAGKRRLTRGRSLRVVKSKHEFTLINEDQKNQINQSSTIVQPTGPTERCTLLLPVPRLSVASPEEQIPLSQQFIFDNKLSKADDLANRRAFWYGEKLAEIVEGSWEDMESEQPGKLRHSGDILIRGQKLSMDMVDTLKRSDVTINLSISETKKLDASDNPILRNYRPWVCEISIRNCLQDPITTALFIEYDKLIWEPSGSNMLSPVRGFNPDLNGTIHNLTPGGETKIKAWALELNPGEICIRAQLHDIATGRSVATSVVNFIVPFQQSTEALASGRATPASAIG